MTPAHLPDGPIKVFFTGGGGAGTIEAIRALKAQGRYEIITADASPASAGFHFADRAYVLPFGADPRFGDALRELLRREHPHFIVPLVDEEIPKVHRLVQAEYPEMRVVAPTLAFCELTMDKWTMAQALAAHGLGVARSWLASDAADATYPAIVKPRTGRGSRGLAFLDGPGDLERYLAAAPQGADQYLVQERLTGREFTTSVVVALDGTLLAVVPKEAVDKRGITQVGVTRAMPAIDAQCRAIVAALAPGGPFNVQSILDASGAPRVIEINPRYSTTMALTLAAGINEVDAVLRHARGLDPGKLTFEPDLMMVRYTAQVYVKEQDWRPTDLRSTPGS
jgi:carbamoyl-phosphate synthase large subunit